MINKEIEAKFSNTDGKDGYMVKCNSCGYKEFKESVSIHKVEDDTIVKLFIEHCYDSNKNPTYANPFIGHIRYASTLKQFRGVLKGILNNMVEEFDYPNWECIIMIGNGIAWKYVYAVGDLKTEDYLEDVSEKDKDKFIQWYRKEYNDKNFTGGIDDLQKYLFAEDISKKIFDNRYNCTE